MLIADKFNMSKEMFDYMLNTYSILMLEPLSLFLPDNINDNKRHESPSLDSFSSDSFDKGYGYTVRILKDYKYSVIIVTK